MIDIRFLIVSLTVTKKFSLRQIIFIKENKTLNPIKVIASYGSNDVNETQCMKRTKKEILTPNQKISSVKRIYKCKICEKLGHNKRTCLNDKLTKRHENQSYCKKRTDFKRIEPIKQHRIYFNNINLRKNKVCSICGDVGHTKIKCKATNPTRFLKAKFYNLTYLCTFCGSKRHLHTRFFRNFNKVNNRFNRNYILCLMNNNKKIFFEKQTNKINKTSNNLRICTYCGKIGHNTRTCGMRRANEALWDVIYLLEGSLCIQD
jgi:hypothetical protein